MSIRSAASCCQERQEIAVPRGARMVRPAMGRLYRTPVACLSGTGAALVPGAEDAAGAGGRAVEGHAELAGGVGGVGAREVDREAAEAVAGLHAMGHPVVEAGVRAGPG